MPDHAIVLGSQHGALPHFRHFEARKAGVGAASTRSGKNWTDIYFFPSLLTYGTAYESPEVGLSYESKIIAKLVLVAEL